MPIKKAGDNSISQTPADQFDRFLQTGVTKATEFAIADDIDVLKQIQFDPSGQATNTTVTIASGAGSGSVKLTLPSSTGTLALASGAVNAFGIAQPITGTSPTASGIDTLTFASAGGQLSIVGNSSTKTLDFSIPNLSGTNTGDVSLAAVGSSPSANGASLSGQVLTLQPADATHPGILTAAKFTTFNSPSTYSANEIFVDTKNGSDSNIGGPSSPYKTIQAALTSVGNAANATAFNDATQAYYVFHIRPGVYTENITIPNRQYVELYMPGVQISGNLTWAMDGANLQTGAVQKPKLVLKGNDSRSMYTTSNYPTTGLTGNITISNTAVTQLVVELQSTGVGGNITLLNTPATNATLLFVTDSIIIGTTSAQTGSQITLYARDCQTSGSRTIGPISGPVLLDTLYNINFVGLITIPSNTNNGNWFNVQFPAAANDFTGSTQNILGDSNSLASFLANVAVGKRGTFTPTYADIASTVGYTPTTSGNWPSVPATVLAGLDNLASTRLVNTIGAFGSTPNSTGLSVSSNTLTLQPADGSDPGAISLAAQTLGAGEKTFTTPPTSPGSGTNTERWGHNASTSTGNDNTVLGSGASGSSAGEDTVMGKGAASTGGSNCVMGRGSNAVGSSVTIGDFLGAGSSATNSVSIGKSGNNLATNTVGVGRGFNINSTGASRTTVIGCQTGSNFADTWVGGYNASATAANQGVFGDAASRILDWYFGGGVVDTAPAQLNMNASGGSGTNVAGANHRVAGGKGTGTGAGGSVILSTAAAGSTGTALNALTDRTVVDSTGLMTHHGDIKLDTLGKTLFVKEGSNAKMGTVVLNGLTPVTVSTTAVTANSRIFLTIQAPVNPGAVYVNSISAGSSFTVDSTSATDGSTLAWLIIEAN